MRRKKNYYLIITKYVFVCHMPKTKTLLYTTHKIVNKQLIVCDTKFLFQKKNILEIIMLKKNTLESSYQIKSSLIFFHDCQNVTTSSYTHTPNLNIHKGLIYYALPKHTVK